MVVPSTSLNYSTSGVSLLKDLLEASKRYYSALRRGVWAEHLARPTFVQGEQITAARRKDLFAVSMSTKYRDVHGFGAGTTVRTSAVPMRVRSSTNIDGDARVYTLDELKGNFGTAFAQTPGYDLGTDEGLVNAKIWADMKSGMHQVFREGDKASFQAIFGVNYLDTENAGAAITSASQTFAQATAGKTPIVITTDLTSTTISAQEKASSLLQELTTAYYQVDSVSGASMADTQKMMHVIVPQWMFTAISQRMAALNQDTWKLDESDGSRNYIYQSNGSYAGIRITGCPTDFFFTTLVSTIKYYVCIAMVSDATVPYFPIQNRSITSVLNPLLNLCGSTLFNDSSSYLQYFLDEMNSVNPMIPYDQLTMINDKYTDPLMYSIEYMLASSQGGVNPWNIKGAIDPRTVEINASCQPLGTGALTSQSVAVYETSFCGSVRANPDYIVPIYIDPTLIGTDPQPSYSEPLTVVNTLVKSSPPSSMSDFLEMHPEAWNEEIEPMTMRDSQVYRDTKDKMEHIKSRALAALGGELPTRKTMVAMNGCNIPVTNRKKTNTVASLDDMKKEVEHA